MTQLEEDVKTVSDCAATKFVTTNGSLARNIGHLLKTELRVSGTMSRN